jgi:hypothetical protein
LLAADNPRRLPAGKVLVADQLFSNGRPAYSCPASVLIEGELRRNGYSTERGPLHLRTTTRGQQQEAALAAPRSARRLPVGGRTAQRPAGVTALVLRGVERAIEVVALALTQRGGPNLRP